MCALQDTAVHIAQAIWQDACVHVCVCVWGGGGGGSIGHYAMATEYRLAVQRLTIKYL